MKVRIDQELCIGDGLCENIAPDVFTVLGDGLGYITDGVDVPRAASVVPSKFEQAVVEAAENCAGDCIFIDRT
ncbi:MAG: ferredoxin [Solirubrobacteraceae bacterium]